MKLNLGAGDERREGWVNVDLRADVADVVADVRHLPFYDCVAGEIVAQDVLEHFSCDDTLAILKEWRRVLKPEGFLTLRVPNMHALAMEIVKHWGDPFLYTLIENIYGGHRWGPGGSWDAHHWGWTPGSLRTDLMAAGFLVLNQNDECNFTTLASKPGESH